MSTDTSMDAHFLDVKILGREYRVACTPKEQEALLAAVDLVDGKMREIAQRTKNTMAERVAVMAALNIAHEYLAGPKMPASENLLDNAVATSAAKRRIADMGARLDAVLAPQQQLDL